nr:uncharacterized protein LOC109426955 [Aedes albopictus]
MKWFQVNSFYESWRPVGKAARVFCLATITANDVDQTLERTSTDHILLVVGLLICGVGLYCSFTIILQQSLILTDSKLLAGGLFGFLILFQSTVISSLVVNYVNGTRTANFFYLIQKIDKHLSNHMDHRWSYQKDHFQAVVYLALRYFMAVVFMYLLSTVSVPMNRLKWTERLSCKRSHTIVHKAICYGPCNSSIFKECSMFSQQLKQHSPSVSCELFDFDWTLYYTMVGSLATYLVILLQFDMDELKLHVIMLDSSLISGGLLAYFMLIELTVLSALVLNYTNGFLIAKFFDIIHKADQQV